MNGLGQHQHTHHSGSWPLRLVPPFTWTGGVSPGSPASLYPCPSTVVAVRGVTPRPWSTTTALSPYRTPERACSRRSRSYTDRRGDGVLRSPVVSLTGSGPRLLGRGLEGVPCVAIDPVAVNRLNHRCGCANTRSHGWSSGSLALTHHVLR